MNTAIQVNPASAVVNEDNKAGSATKPQVTVKARRKKKEVSEQMVNAMIARMHPLWRGEGKARLVLLLLANNMSYKQAAKKFKVSVENIMAWTEVFLRDGTEGLQKQPRWYQWCETAEKEILKYKKLYRDLRASQRGFAKNQEGSRS